MFRNSGLFGVGDLQVALLTTAWFSVENDVSRVSLCSMALRRLFPLPQGCGSQEATLEEAVSSANADACDLDCSDWSDPESCLHCL